MKGEERKDVWTKDDNANNKDVKTQPKSTTPAATSGSGTETSAASADVHEIGGDESTAPDSVISLGSLSGSAHVSDNSEEDSAGHERRSGQHESEEASHETSGNEGTSKEMSSPFLFIGPVGKKRRCCREKRTSGDTEPDVLSPVSVPTTPDLTSTPDPPPLVDDISEDSSRSRGSGSSREGGQEEASLVTSTPTSVIRSTPRKRGDDQPLNLSTLPVDPQSPQPHCSFSYPRRDQRLRVETSGDVVERVSVINIIPRERLTEEAGDEEEEGSLSRSPSHYLHEQPHSSDLPELGYEHSGGGISGGHHHSPCASASASADFFTISPGSALSSAAALSPGGPSSFQGLLLAQGIIQQGNGGSCQKKKLKCRDCGKEFSQLRNYKYHRSRHEGTQQFACTCPVCGKTFNDKGYLSSHLKIHRNEKEYKCEWCGKSFNQRVAYNMHIRIHTGHKPHKCSYCAKAFSRKMLLRQHIRTHTGERPYKCSICMKAFADRSNMLLHQRLHSGERPYKCHICGKSFSKNHHLKTHLNHHAGIKPYQCEKCKACFSQSSNMKTHFRKCTGIPSATVTSESFDSQQTSGPSGSSGSRSGAGMGGNLPSIIPQNLSPYSMEEVQEAVLLEEQLQQQQHHRLRQLQQQGPFIGLSPMQQQQILQEMERSSFLGPSPGGPSSLHSPSTASSSPRSGYRSSTSTNSQALGFNLGSMSLNSPTGLSRSRQPSGLSLIPLSNPSPTSLAAGHPFIPLESVNMGGSSSTGGPTSGTPHNMSPSSPSSLIMSSPRHQNIGDLSPSEYSQIQSFTQSIAAQQRSLSNRSRTIIPQTVVSHEQQHQGLIDQGGEMQNPAASSSSGGRSSHHHQLSPHQIPIPRISPGRQYPLSPRQSQAQQAQEYYEVILPALAISRSMTQLSPRQSQHLRAEMLADQQHHQQQMGGVLRHQDLHRIYRVQNPRLDSRSQFQVSQQQQHQQQGLLSSHHPLPPLQSGGTLPSIASLTRTTPTSQNSHDTFRDSLAGSMEQRIREAQHETWRLREAAAGRNSGGGGGGPSDKSPFNKDGQYRH
ncbi:uncharacterized protein LOC110853775 isoform X3 [Folsomia candida]|uniref:uncharacterized protein LOC110853775 isoform X3 n=1 Tax=Folsomia candida TaxID=158441 RepID=UPI000B8EF3AF|nr:uncharacterized protein LOC110853775 isoform X3 [Folsomia candida]